MRGSDHIDSLRGVLLMYLGNEEGRTSQPDLSFECGILAALDWVMETDSYHAGIAGDVLNYVFPAEGGTMKRVKYEVAQANEIDLEFLARTQEGIVVLVSWHRYDGRHQMVAIVTDKGAKAVKEVGMNSNTATHLRVDEHGRLVNIAGTWSGGGYVLCSTRVEMGSAEVVANATAFMKEYNSRKGGVIEVAVETVE